MKNYYKVLSVPSDATSKEIEKAYQRLARQYNPEGRNGDEYAEERFIDISLAYKTLSNQSKREDYDRILNSILSEPVKFENYVSNNVTAKSNTVRRNILIVASGIILLTTLYIINNRGNSHSDTEEVGSVITTPIDESRQMLNMPVDTNEAESGLRSSADEPKVDTVGRGSIVKAKEINKIPPAKAVEDTYGADVQDKLDVNEIPQEYIAYSIGASKNEVLKAQGTPTGIAKFDDVREVWFYGKSEVHFQKGKVIVCKNLDGNLKLK